MHCNDSSTKRLTLLRRMLLSYIPKQSGLREKVLLKRMDAGDATRWHFEPGQQYDKVPTLHNIT